MWSIKPRRINNKLPVLQVKGRDITEEERKMLEEEGVNIPYNVVLTKVTRVVIYEGGATPCPFIHIYLAKWALA